MSGKAANNPYSHYKMVVDPALESDNAVPLNPVEYANAIGAPQPQPQQPPQPQRQQQRQTTTGVSTKGKRHQTPAQRALQVKRYQDTCAKRRKRSEEEAARKEKETIANKRARFIQKFRPPSQQKNNTNANDTNMKSTTINNDSNNSVDETAAEVDNITFMCSPQHHVHSILLHTHTKQ